MSSSASTNSAGSRSKPQVRPVTGLSADDLSENLIDVIERAELDLDINDTELFEEDLQLWRRSTLPHLDLPGFGEPEDDCGEYSPTGMFTCPCCSNVVEFKHNCYRYDCPIHAPHAIRRRAAGSKSMPGVVAKIAALRAWLDSYYKQHHIRFHRLVFSPPQDFFWRSDQPLERAFDLIGEMLDVFGAQGFVVYHPWAGSDGDDRGEWKQRLFSGRDWQGDVADELVPRGHFHVYAVGKEIQVGTDADGYALDVDELDEDDHDGADDGTSVSELVQEETGWVIKRIEPYAGSSVSIYDEEDLARSVTYGLSHAGVYETESGQRRLAARFKGPDWNEVDVQEHRKRENAAIVNDIAEDTLGVTAPDLTCDRELATTSISLPSSSSSSSSSSGTSSASRSTELPTANNADISGEVIVGSSGPVDASSNPPSTPETSTSTSVERCGADLIHISEVDLELLTSLDDQGFDTEDLQRAYQDYKAYMAARGLDDGDRLEIPEFEDRPPPD